MKRTFRDLRWLGATGCLLGLIAIAGVAGGAGAARADDGETMSSEDEAWILPIPP